MNSPFQSLGIRLFGVLLVLSLLSSCAKLVSDEFPDFEPVPAVNSILVAGETISVQVSMAEKIDTTYLHLVDNAELLLSDGTGRSESMLSLGDGLYGSSMIALPGESYECSILLEGYAELHAGDTIPIITEVAITDHTNTARFDVEGNYMEGIEFEFRDDPSTEDYYEVALFRREHDWLGNVYPFNENCAILLNEGLEPYSTETLVFSDLLMEDSIVSMKVDFHSGYHTTCWGEDSCFQRFDEHTVILEFRHISRDYYHYKKHFYLYEKNRYPFFVEGTTTGFPIYSNIENGMGILASYAWNIDSIFVEEELLFSD